MSVPGILLKEDPPREMAPKEEEKKKKKKKRKGREVTNLEADLFRTGIVLILLMD